MFTCSSYYIVGFRYVLDILSLIRIVLTSYMCENMKEGCQSLNCVLTEFILQIF